MTYYIFQSGRLVLAKGESLPSSLPSSLSGAVINSGEVDRQRPDGDMWVEIASDAVLPAGFSQHERRGLWTVIGEKDFFRMGKAFHLMDWRRTHKFCGACGAGMSYDDGEHAMKCPNCGVFEYPRIAPAIIVAVEREGKLLLAHGVNFPQGRFSVLAGFVEPGESLEECVEREVYEESGVRLKNIKYFGSQPWPFPHSLMLGFTAEWESGEIVPDMTEVTDVRWFAVDEIPEYYRGVSISAKLIEDFIGRHSQEG